MCVRACLLCVRVALTVALPAATPQLTGWKHALGFVSVSFQAGVLGSEVFNQERERIEEEIAHLRSSISVCVSPSCARPLRLWRCSPAGSSMACVPPFVSPPPSTLRWNDHCVARPADDTNPARDAGSVLQGLFVLAMCAAKPPCVAETHTAAG